MPTYDAQCPRCGAVQEYFSSIADCEKTPNCPKCGVATEPRIFAAPLGFVRGNFEPFVSTIDGTVVRTDRELAEHNKRNNVMLLNDAYSDKDIADFPNRDFSIKPDKKDIEKDVEAAIQDCVDGYKPHLETMQEDE